MHARSFTHPLHAHTQGERSGIHLDSLYPLDQLKFSSLILICLRFSKISANYSMANVSDISVSLPTFGRMSVLCLVVAPGVWWVILVIPM